jgi:hypothetical protein
MPSRKRSNSRSLNSHTSPKSSEYHTPLSQPDSFDFLIKKYGKHTRYTHDELQNMRNVYNSEYFDGRIPTRSILNYDKAYNKKQNKAFNRGIIGRILGKTSKKKPLQSKYFSEQQGGTRKRYHRKKK